MSKQIPQLQQGIELSTIGEEGDFLPNVQHEFESAQSLSTHKRFFTFIYKDVVADAPADEERQSSPLKSSNWFSQIFFLWLIPLIKLGYRRDLVKNDIWLIDESLVADKLYREFEHNLKLVILGNQENYAKTHPDASATELRNLPYPRYSLVLSLFYTFKRQYILALVYVFLASLSTSFAPLLTQKLIRDHSKSTNEDRKEMGKRLGLVFGISSLFLFGGITFHHCLQNASLTSIQTYVVLMKAIIKKTYRSSNEFLESSSLEPSMILIDLAKIKVAMCYFHLLIVFPIPVIISFTLLIINLGVTSLIGIAIFAAMIVTTVFFFLLLLNRRDAITILTEERKEIAKEVINNVKSLKMLSWEEVYSKKIQEKRIKELKENSKLYLISSMIYSFSVSLSDFSSMITLVSKIKISGNFIPWKVFPSLTLFDILAMQTLLIPFALSTSSDGWMAMKRLQDLLEVRSDDLKINPKRAVPPADNRSALDVLNICVTGSVKCEDSGTSRETSTNKAVSLQDVSFWIKKGEFTVIMSPHSHESLFLLETMAGFQTVLNGEVHQKGNSLLCEADIIFSTSVQDNITFGTPFYEERYSAVIKLTLLDTEIHSLPSGDKTIVGKNGFLLSKSQKAKIAVARAIYREKIDSYLFGDVLRAFDDVTRSTILKRCLTGILKDKTIVMITSNLETIKLSNKILFVNDGSVETGLLPELILYQTNLLNLLRQEKVHQKCNNHLNIENERSSKLKQKLLVSNASEVMTDTNLPPWKILWNYFIRYLDWKGKVFIMGYAIVVLATVTTSIVYVVWLSFWIDQKFPQTSETTYMIVFIFMVFIKGLFLVIQFLFLSYQGIKASKLSSFTAINHILQVSMVYFDSVLPERIIETLEKDMGNCDHELIDQLFMLIYQITLLVGVLSLFLALIPFMFIILVLFGVCFLIILKHYQCAIREVKRLATEQQQQVEILFEELLQERKTIKSYEVEQYFQMKIDAALDQLHEFLFVESSLNRWIYITSDIFAALLILVILIFCVTEVFELSPSTVGVIVVFLLQLGILVNSVIRYETETESQMNTFHRLTSYYPQIPQEKNYNLVSQQVSPSWPQHGAILFDNVSLSYSPKLPNALVDFSLEIEPGEKIGICGKAGAGKNSIVNALYRFAEITRGSVQIDDLDTAKVDLHNLRSKLSFIPQDPVLFKGTVRSNLDATGNLDDVQLWNALVNGGAIDARELPDVKDQEPWFEYLHKFHLDHPVYIGGSNYTTSERQTLSLARAIVRKPKVVILDEPTVNVDLDTRTRIQTLISKNFEKSTVICIAHKLKTVLHYDRIVVLEKGRIAQCGPPLALYRDKEGLFREFCNRSGITERHIVLG